MLSFYHLLHECRLNLTCFDTIPFIFYDAVYVEEWAFAGADPLAGEMLPVVCCRLARSPIAEPLVASWEGATAGGDEMGLCAVCTKALYNNKLKKCHPLSGLQRVMQFLWVSVSLLMDHALPPRPASVWKCVTAIIAFIQPCTTNFPGCSFSACAVRCAKISLSARDHPELTVRGIDGFARKGFLLQGAAGSKWWRGDTCLVLKINCSRKELNAFDCHLPIKQASTCKHLWKHPGTEQNGICWDLFGQLLPSLRCSSVQPGGILPSQLLFPAPQPWRCQGMWTSVLAAQCAPNGSGTSHHASSRGKRRNLGWA